MGKKRRSKICFPESKRSRFILVLATFVVALLITQVLISAPIGIGAAGTSEDARFTLLLLFFFPVGLFTLFPPLRSLGESGAVLGWLVYLIFSIVIINVQKPRTAFIFYIVLIVLLLANAGGCTLAINNTSWQ